eukprot:50142-Eustigmatos_ZCMA.PRE.2
MILDAFPPSHKGRPRKPVHLILDRINYVLRTGCQWRLLPIISGISWQTVHRNFVKWSRCGIFEKAYRHLVTLYVKRNRHKRTALITDCSFIKNVYGTNCVGSSPVDRGRKATKLSVIADERGVVLAASFHKGNKVDYKAFLHTFTQSKCLQTYLSGKTFYADRAYDNHKCDSVVGNAGLINHCARKGTSTYFPPTRGVVEHVFSWLDKCRRIVLRYERHIVHHKSFTYMALSRRILTCLT